MKIRQPDLVMAWAGTPDGPERQVVEANGFVFYPIPVAKLPTYLSVRWLTWPFDYLRALFAARRVVKNVQPNLVASAGGFTGVSVIREAARLGIPCVIHQLDVEPGLANRVVAPKCRLATTSFRYERPPFSSIVTEQMPTPSRFATASIPSKEEAAAYLRLDPNKLCILITGGGTGALSLNEAIWEELPNLLAVAQVVHLTGYGKGRAQIVHPGYLQAEFFDERSMLCAETVADVVVSRAGMGSIAELVALQKCAILVPLPDTHQEANAARLPFPVVAQDDDFARRLRETILRLCGDREERTKIAVQAQTALSVDDGSALAERWLGFLQ
jgi:UDP-N-acetylglucosamine--N-acetylmuramyl-(pentapeptide) pyrophosphoryl-undecaprenol N-acetylglucosamine transferase